MTTTAVPVTRTHGNSYEIFILVLTVLSLMVMVLLFLPLSAATHEVLRFYDNLICLVFLADFVYNMTGSHPRREYFLRGRGWLDLLGSVPSLGILQFTAILRLARLSRFVRILRMLGSQRRADLVRDVVRNRSQYALFITLMLVMVVLTSASVLVLEFESRSPDANITSGGDALWWAFVTLTTVGYGDRFPVTALGRTTAAAVMFAGIGVIGALASILASMLVSPASPDDESEASEMTQSTATAAVVGEELARTRAELEQAQADLAELRRLVAAREAKPEG